MQENRKREIRVKADEFREKCKVGRYGIIDLFRDCDRLGYKLIRYPQGDAADLGFCLLRDGDEVIYTNSSSRLSREIFTLAHEIGHLILHMGIGNSFMDDSLTISGRVEDENEKEANYFAACLLMPAEDVHKFIDHEIADFESNRLGTLDVARMMSEFNVSFDMALNRLESLGIISGEEKLLLDNERNEMKVGNLLRSVGGNSRLNMPAGEICIPFEYLDYVIYNYNHKAIPKETLERVLNCYQLGIEDIADRLIAQEDEDEGDLDDLIGGLKVNH